MLIHINMGNFIVHAYACPVKYLFIFLRGYVENYLKYDTILLD
jgi:hypothetical protein